MPVSAALLFSSFTVPAIILSIEDICHNSLCPIIMFHCSVTSSFDESGYIKNVDYKKKKMSPVNVLCNLYVLFEKRHV